MGQPALQSKAHDGVNGASNARGVSFVETLLVVSIVLVLSAMAFPAVTRTLKIYRLSSTATSISNVLQRARYEAIKRNTNTYFRIAQQGTMWALYIDVDNSGTITTGDPELLLSQDIQLDLTGSAPAATTMGYSSTTTFPNLPTLSSIQFNSRGTVAFSGSPTVYVLYLSVPGQPRYGYRALAVTPSAKTKVWMATAGGSWQSQ